jgi:hypothetical protein
MTAVCPEIVIHQLTDLPLISNRAAGQKIIRATRIRIEGTRNLVAAALEAGVRRIIAQAWVYAEGPQLYSENAPLDLRAEAPYAIVVEGVARLE